MKHDDRFVEVQADFDRWLDQVQAEAKSRALEDAADDWEDTTWQDTWLADDVHDDVSAVQSTVRWLRERAARVRAGEQR